ncbi:universal stress protein [Nonomuraea sp. NPDC049421]|uniref:universal stress protein n=1 Tax=Nonomuraea sp. NPDC049421 TaxID=3155275 RepID=UPI00344191F8
MNDIVLGYDGSDFSMQALDWALDEAELRHLPLSVVHAWQWPYGEAEEEAKAHLRKAADHVLWHGAECARSTSSGVQVESELYEGPAAQRLVELSGSASLIVVGSRGLSALPRAVVGSVAGYVAAHADCPVIVVRGPGPLPKATRPGPIVLADDKPHEAAAEFALIQAALRQLPLATSADVGEPAAHHPQVCIQQGEPHEPPTLVVVGRKSSAPFGIASFLSQHAPCPVAIVPEPPA